MDGCNQNQDFIDGLRSLARFLEEHPEINANYNTLQVDVFTDKLAEVARSGYGMLAKETRTDWFSLRKSFSQSVWMYWNTSREKVCKRVVTGTKIIPAKPERLLPAEPEQVVETWEWQCPDSLLRDDDSQPATIPDGVNGLSEPDGFTEPELMPAAVDTDEF